MVGIGCTSYYNNKLVDKWRIKMFKIYIKKIPLWLYYGHVDVITHKDES